MMRAPNSRFSLHAVWQVFSPWLVLGAVFPAVILLNTVFLNLFPTHPVSNLPQTLFVYSSRNPDELFGNFYYTLGTQLAARGQLLPAESMLSKAAKLQPDNAYVFLNYGIVLESLKKNDEALRAYAEAVRLSPKLVQAHYSLGLLYDKNNQTDRGIEHMQKAVTLEPDNQFINYDIGVLYAKKGDFEKSAFYSKKALEGADGDSLPEAYNNYGYALAQLGQYDAALVAVEKSLELKPDSAAAMDSKGFALFGLKRYDDALKVYLEALNMDPTIGEIYLHLAQTYEKLQTADKAVKAYETYLQMTPDAPDKRQVEEKIRQLGKWNTQNSRKP